MVDWVQVFARSGRRTGLVLVVLEVVYTITDPPIRFVRRFVPPLRLGGDRARPEPDGRADLCYLLQYLVSAIFFG